MASAVYPAAVTQGNTSFVTCETAQRPYISTCDLASGVYVVSCISTTIARVEFFNGDPTESASTLIGTATTATGTVTFNLASPANFVRAWTNTGTDIIVAITLSGLTLVSVEQSGTLDVLTGSGTYTTTSPNGTADVALVGGGSGGNGGVASSTKGNGGSGGKMLIDRVTLTGSLSYAIGAGGSGGAGGGGGGQAGGAITFGDLTSTGGTAGAIYYGWVTDYGFNGNGGNGNNAISGGGSTSGNGTAGVGIGGTGGGNNGQQGTVNAAQAGQGKGAGGGGGGWNQYGGGAGAAGSAGVIYVFRPN